MNALLLTMTYIEIEDSLRGRLLRKTSTVKSVSESPDLARVKEESYKAYIEEELSLRKRRKEIHPARLWRHWAAGEWCWCSRVKGGVFLGPARGLLQERQTTTEGVRMNGVVWITEGTSLVRCVVLHLRSFSESETGLRGTADTEPIRFQDLAGLPFATEHVS